MSRHVMGERFWAGKKDQLRKNKLAEEKRVSYLKLKQILH